MATVSMTKGAELAGVSKGTVSKALKSGRLSCAEKTDNGYLIDTSELFRVFPPKQPETVEEARLDTPVGNRETLMETGGCSGKLNCCVNSFVIAMVWSMTCGNGSINPRTNAGRHRPE